MKSDQAPLDSLDSNDVSVLFPLPQDPGKLGNLLSLSAKTVSFIGVRVLQIDSSRSWFLVEYSEERKAKKAWTHKVNIQR